jgi:hypothetical protein
VALCRLGSEGEVDAASFRSASLRAQPDTQSSGSGVSALAIVALSAIYAGGFIFGRTPGVPLSNPIYFGRFHAPILLLYWMSDPEWQQHPAEVRLQVAAVHGRLDGL